VSVLLMFQTLVVASVRCAAHRPLAAGIGQREQEADPDRGGRHVRRW
jgi:hypothetical protein